MADELSGKKVAILAADGVERVELEQPRSAVTDAGAEVELLSIHDGEIAARNHDLEDAGTFAVDGLVSDASVGDYDALLLPGGTVNPDQLRMNQDAVAFVREFFESGKPIGTICHGPWTLLEAGVVEGRQITSYPSVRTDLRNAGANVLDQEVVVDEGLVSSRKPDDLPAFCAKVVEEFCEGRHDRAAA
jgi:protease I